MKRLKKNSSLFEVAPELVKEWHPTANGKLTPRNLEVVYPKKVWWICSEGHEWQATIKDRINQNDCPNCKSRVTVKMPDADLSNPGLGREFRKYKRHTIKGLAVVELPSSGHWVYAELKNYSSQGLCFETDAAMKPGSKINIKFDKALVSSRLNKSHISSDLNGLKTYSSQIRWCKKLDDDQSISSFACGVKVI